MSQDTDVVSVPILGKEAVFVGFNLERRVCDFLIENAKSSAYVIVTDTNIAPHYLEKYTTALSEAAKRHGVAPRILTRVIPPGETSKCRSMKAEIEDWMLSQSCTRDTVLVAMGGGVIGDMAGYVAATFMRGIRFIQLPTTLLAMVDSSIGGKTAIDTPNGKNLVGAFWQPLAVFADLNFLETLEPRQFINGMGEVIKTAAMWNEKDFCLLEQNPTVILEAVHRPRVPGQFKFENIRNLLQKIILASVRTKCEVVTLDEREGGLRNLLNFGHSIGHAYEAILFPQILHGECVSIGMVKELELSRYLGILKPNAVGRVTKCLMSYTLPVSVHDAHIKKYAGYKKCPVDKLIRIMAVDKKNQGLQKRVVILKAVGETYEKHATVVSDEDIRVVLSHDIQVSPFDNSVSDVVVTPPGSKSISNRALILAAMAKGTTKLTNMLHSDDTQVMMAALEELGAATFSWEDNGETLVVNGGGKFKTPSKELYLSNAGTAARFLTTVAALVGENEQGGEVVLTGNHRMKVRPIGPLVDALRANGCSISYLEREGSLPLKMIPQNGLRGGVIELAATVSSQYVSSILMCAPYAQEPVTLKLVGGKPISQLYVDMTIAMMKGFGVNVVKSETEAYTYHIPKANYTSPGDYEIESDASSATYPLAFAAITGTKCTVPNIGSASLQGDARFARDVLAPMGCTVEQTPTSTTVQGPPMGQLKPLESVDMETMTDAFLTATALAAVACNSSGNEHITRITGIANQRVKECNRIAAMVHELAKFGVKAGELEDGIFIHGQSYKDLKTPEEGIYTYDDHRVAMAFSILTLVTPKPTVILDKACVVKTWPYWWDVLRNSFKIKLAGVESKETVKSVKLTRSRASVILIGMRGAGKTTIGSIIAGQLNMKFLDLDQELEKKLNTTIPDLVNTRGWDDFRQEELQVLQEFIDTKSSDFVAACGGGIVETPAARELLCKYVKEGGIVLHIHRNLDQVLSYLSIDKSRPAYADRESTKNVYLRRHQWYLDCRSHDFVSPTIESGNVQSKLETSMSRFLRVVTGKSTWFEKAIQKPHSFFLSLTFPNINDAISFLPEAIIGCDAVELRADLLEDPNSTTGYPSVEFVAEQFATLRAAIDLPIIFTVRSKDQGGRFPNANESEAVELMLAALRWGVDVLDLELGWSTESLQAIYARKENTKIITSWHDTAQRCSWAQPDEWLQKLDMATAFGDVVKFVGIAKSMQDNFDLEKFRKSFKGYTNKPLIAINMGTVGQLSRVFNNVLTPVTSPALPYKAAPGQLSVRQIITALSLMGSISPKKFYLFGTPIQHSKSPILHKTCYDLTGLPYTYDLFETESVEGVKDVLSQPDFGGANVTIPYKLDILQYLDELSDEARFLGAVNTVVPISENGKRKLRGDNTDWRGIVRTFVRAGANNLNGKNALVIGAGGTSRAAIFAMHKLGAKNIYLLNRTLVNAEKVKAVFPEEYNVKVIDHTKQSEISEWTKLQVAAVVSTVPADRPLPESVSKVIDALLSEIPAQKKEQYVFLDMAYKPLNTPLMSVASKHGYTCINGLEVLLQQGLASFEIWTGLAVPFEHVFGLYMVLCAKEHN
ncbi:pentafunctional aromatic polypeptide Aro1 [Schizosaccharomyces japonicus yFS275]|uniref:Pentafunctional AROM polypeptide n=1 Tax=Schizosaccharomyces japonicus (strain yFS275 / FY16936) TaxID=402676 RepID=ARO1_SCHJY|nr:pentafunctional aromatic polypeptide Aro1 [Schizosaccharomyces japonicus yFS275]B6JVD0.1 RecName: Full=Pentafunctional AROM polypeptide; Includes: RecName: Full=3-dehydroquinate synthase; Short=DHQS; Includes: RecName: Full=3-phosphoshikimate 1-carboxyvinyltransferase; AltName: Full=5-enolpyruvylshikimate-3-phosphate synthase; Short=EPSP synthase; Short=EPSPS; Includes: RecName: Full=Shikimate kinase; Short=SK; Includes: RecName: Full=3-dehydroquinate dehydratase; Short=3-dehydroquinase; Includ